MDDTFTKAIFKKLETQPLFKEEIDNAVSMRCFDSYFSFRGLGDCFWFKTAVRRCPALDEFWMALTNLTDLRIRRFRGFVNIVYSHGYTMEEKFIYDYVIHQFARVPTIIATLAEEDGTQTEIPESFQDCLEKTILDGNFYFAFNIRFDYREVLKRLVPGRLNKEIINTAMEGQKKQSWIVSEILRPAAVMHVPTGKFIQRNMYNEDAIELLQFYKQDSILEKVLADTPVVIEKFPLHPRLKLIPLE